MDLFEATEQLAEAREKLGGVCELLDCAAAAPDEIGGAGLAMLAERAMEAYTGLARGIELLERAQEENPPMCGEADQDSDIS